LPRHLGVVRTPHRTAPSPAAGTLVDMQLRNARLCLDCEEVHDATHCPVCASESLAFISRWVPAPERRTRPRPPEPTDPEGLETYRQLLDADRQQTGWQTVRKGALGLALVGVAGWLWRRRDARGGLSSVAPRASGTRPDAMAPSDAGRRE
jgi:hypothetical protein